MADLAQNKLRGLVLSAAEIREMTKRSADTSWPDSLIEDYLTQLENSVILAETIDKISSGVIFNITNVTGTPYTILSTDAILLVDASIENMTLTLPTSIGIEGKTYIIEKIDSTTNIVTVDGSGAETINSDSQFDLLDQYESVEPTAILFSDFSTNWMI